MATMSSEPVVILIDDDAAVLDALALLLHSVKLEVETYSSADAFLTGLQTRLPSPRACIVTDVRMPGMSGLDLQAELARRNVRIPIIVISAHADVPITVRAMQSGALSVLEKPVNEQELIDLIHRALNDATADAPLANNPALEERRARLTDRQRDVFDALMRGLQTKEVARRLGLSHRTVEVHRANILERLQVGSFSQLLRELLAHSKLG